MVDVKFEFYSDSRGEIAFENLDELLEAIPENAERAIESAMKSEGYRLRNEMRDYIESRGDGSWDELNPHTGILGQAKRGYVKNWKMVWRGKKGKKKRGREYKEVMLSSKKNPMAKFAGAVRYFFDKDTQTIHIGFIQNPGLSPSFIKLAQKHAAGFKIPVTPKMRKFLFALGFPIKKETTELESPPRPIIEPVFKKEEKNIFANIETKFYQNLDRYMSEKP